MPSKIKMGCMQTAQWWFAGHEAHPCTAAAASVASTPAGSGLPQLCSRKGLMHAMTEAVCELPSPHMQAMQLLRYP